MSGVMSGAGTPTMAGQYDAPGKMERYLAHERTVNGLGATGSDRQTGLAMIAGRLDTIAGRLESSNSSAAKALLHLAGEWENSLEKSPGSVGSDGMPMLGRLEHVVDRLVRAAERQELLVAQLEKI